MERSLDYKGRWRNHTVAFRVSDEEAKLLNDLVAAIHEELKRLETVGPDNDELLYTLQVIAITLEGLKGEDE